MAKLINTYGGFIRFVMIIAKKIPLLRDYLRNDDFLSNLQGEFLESPGDLSKVFNFGQGQERRKVTTTGI
ncbi:MAG: hypothetical protein JRL30_15365 [Deltaproteobacteria bacterium]|nr:hypothetical protein [Deltaproteobacteria bacterium]